MDSRTKLVNAGELGQELDIPAEFETDHHRTRRKRRQFTYYVEDEPIEILMLNSRCTCILLS